MILQCCPTIYMSGHVQYDKKLVEWEIADKTCLTMFQISDLFLS